MCHFAPICAMNTGQNMPKNNATRCAATSTQQKLAQSPNALTGTTRQTTNSQRTSLPDASSSLRVILHHLHNSVPPHNDQTLDLFVVQTDLPYNGSIRQSTTHGGECSMTVAELTNQIMALPLAERVAIAQKVWESLDDEHAEISPQTDGEAVAVARRRDDAMSRGDVLGRSHEEVMSDARRSIK